MVIPEIAQFYLKFDSCIYCHPERKALSETNSQHHSHYYLYIMHNSIYCSAVYIDLDPSGGNPKINIDTGLTDTPRKWKVSVTQIACNSAYKGAVIMFLTPTLFL